MRFPINHHWVDIHISSVDTLGTNSMYLNVCTTIRCLLSHPCRGGYAFLRTPCNFAWFCFYVTFVCISVTAAARLGHLVCVGGCSGANACECRWWFGNCLRDDLHFKFRFRDDLWHFSRAQRELDFGGKADLLLTRPLSILIRLKYDRRCDTYRYVWKIPIMDFSYRTTMFTIIQCVKELTWLKGNIEVISTRIFPFLK